MTVAAPPASTRFDAFLGGRVEAVQSETGHRSGLEAVLLGAALPESFTGTVADLGSGAGVAAMCLAARAPGLMALAVDRDPVALGSLRASLARPANAAFAARVTPILADIAAPETERAAAGLGRAVADAVVMNPPFYVSGQGTPSPDTARAAAHILGDAHVEPWFRAAASVLKPGGTLVLIFRADAVGDLLTAATGRFGAIALLPIHPRTGQPAHRILLRATKGSRAPLAFLPGLVLHGEAGNAYVPQIEAILREGRGLAEAHPPWGVAP